MLFDYLFSEDPVMQLDNIYKNSWKEKGDKHEVQNSERKPDDNAEDNRHDNE